MAAIHVPRRYMQEGWKKKQPRGFEPRGTLRGGPERPADDPGRNPRDGLCGGPARSAREPQTSFQTTSKHKTSGGEGEKEKAEKPQRPIIITVDVEGHERKWGQLSRVNALRAYRFFEDMNGAVQFFLQKGGKRDQVQAEMRLAGGRRMVWCEEKTAQPPRGQEGGDGATTEKTAMQVIGQEEIQTEQMTALFEKVASLERANEEKERKIQEMEMKMTLLAQTIQENEARRAAVERAITEIAQNIQRQDLFNDSASTSISGLVEEVRKHQDYFQEVVRIFQNHEEHIRRNDVLSDGMAQYINALVQDTEKKRL